MVNQASWLFFFLSPLLARFCWLQTRFDQHVEPSLVNTYLNKSTCLGKTNDYAMTQAKQKLPWQLSCGDDLCVSPRFQGLPPRAEAAYLSPSTFPVTQTWESPSHCCFDSAPSGRQIKAPLRASDLNLTAASGAARQLRARRKRKRKETLPYLGCEGWMKRGPLILPELLNSRWALEVWATSSVSLSYLCILRLWRCLLLCSLISQRLLGSQINKYLPDKESVWLWASHAPAASSTALRLPHHVTLMSSLRMRVRSCSRTFPSTLWGAAVEGRG